MRFLLVAGVIVMLLAVNLSDAFASVQQQGELGSICVSAYYDTNENGRLESNEVLISGAKIEIFNSSHKRIAWLTTDGFTEPNCTPVESGDYKVIAESPKEYIPTNQSEWEFSLSKGNTVSINFGVLYPVPSSSINIVKIQQGALSFSGLSLIFLAAIIGWMLSSRSFSTNDMFVIICIFLIPPLLATTVSCWVFIFYSSPYIATDGGLSLLRILANVLGVLGICISLVSMFYQLKGRLVEKIAIVTSLITRRKRILTQWMFADLALGTIIAALFSWKMIPAPPIGVTPNFLVGTAILLLLSAAGVAMFLAFTSSKRKG